MSRYIKGAKRRYVQITPAQFAEVERWYLARQALGSQKEKAAAMGVAFARFQALCVRVRAAHPKGVL
jgi:hypothetical protein